MERRRYFHWRCPRLLACVVLALVGQGARAQVEICNESRTYHYSVAIAYWNQEVQEWVSRGWFRLQPSKCAKAVALPLTREYVYLHARYGIPAGQPTGNDLVDLMGVIMSAGSAGEITGEYSFCTQRKAFSLIGSRRCVSRGFELSQAVEIELKKGVRGLSIELHDEGRYSFSALR